MKFIEFCQQAQQRQHNAIGSAAADLCKCNHKREDHMFKVASFYNGEVPKRLKSTGMFEGHAACQGAGANDKTGKEFCQCKAFARLIKYAEYQELSNAIRCDVRCKCTHPFLQHGFRSNRNLFIGNNRANDKGIVVCGGAEEDGSNAFNEYMYFGDIRAGECPLKCPCKEFRPLKRYVNVREETYAELLKLVAQSGGAIETVDDIIMERVDAYRKIREERGS